MAAGLRIGFAFGRPELLAAMNKLRTPFNTSGVRKRRRWRDE